MSIKDKEKNKITPEIERSVVNIRSFTQTYVIAELFCSRMYEKFASDLLTIETNNNIKYIEQMIFTKRR